MDRRHSNAALYLMPHCNPREKRLYKKAPVMVTMAPMALLEWHFI